MECHCVRVGVAYHRHAVASKVDPLRQREAEIEEKRIPSLFSCHGPARSHVALWSFHDTRRSTRFQFLVCNLQLPAGILRLLVPLRSEQGSTESIHIPILAANVQETLRINSILIEFQFPIDSTKNTSSSGNSYD